LVGSSFCVTGAAELHLFMTTSLAISAARYRVAAHDAAAFHIPWLGEAEIAGCQAARAQEQSDKPAAISQHRVGAQPGGAHPEQREIQFDVEACVRRFFDLRDAAHNLALV